jgi:hypothetical protein
VTISAKFDRDFSILEDPKSQPELYKTNMFPILEVCPLQLRNAKVSLSWAGHYTYNPLDKTNYIFTEKNVIVATGPMLVIS